MAVEIGLRGAEHLLEHLRLSLCDEALDELLDHRDVDADRARDPAGLIAGGENNVLALVGVVVCDDNPCSSVDLPDFLDRFACDISDAEASCGHIVCECRLQRVRVAVGRAPARADDLIGEIGVDFLYFFRSDHADIEAARGGLVGQLLQRLEVLLRLSEAEVALLVVLYVVAELLRECRPEIVDAVHGNRKLTRVAA